MLRIALAQINPTVGDLSGNRQKIAYYIAQAKTLKSDIVAFPELAITGYPPEDLLYKEHFIRDNIKSLNVLVSKVKDIVAIVGFVDIDKEHRPYNAAAIIFNGKVRAVYHKKALPNYGVFDEKRYFSPGGVDNKIFALGQHLFGVNICEDVWVENGIYVHQARQGARLLVNISSSPYDIDKLKKRQALLKKRACKINTFFCYVNLVGGQDELVFDGGSFVVDPKGKIIACAKEFEEDLLVADIGVSLAKKIKGKDVVLISKTATSASSEKLLAMQRVEQATGTIERIYKALVLGTRDYVYKNNFKDVLVGLSGGADSSLVAAIAADALGKENVIGVSMPSRFNSPDTQSDARKVAENLGIRFLEIPIEPMFEVYLDQLNKVWSMEPASCKEKNNFIGLPEQNLQARIRGAVLMTLSNRWGSLVLTTGNKSEVGVGYCTLYGDMSGGFAIVKDVPKTTVYELARFVNECAGKDIIPKSVLERVPSAELCENQKDQDTLPPYDILDKMLKEYVEEHRSLAQMSRKADKELIKKVIAMVDHNEYKRRQGPPGIKITPRAFGKDWRLPITNKYRED